MMQPNCADCKHSFGTESPHCGAPQLGALLDQTHERNMSTPCDGARAFLLACGQQARWFVKKSEVAKITPS